MRGDGVAGGYVGVHADERAAGEDALGESAGGGREFAGGIFGVDAAFDGDAARGEDVG